MTCRKFLMNEQKVHASKIKFHARIAYRSSMCANEYVFVSEQTRLTMWMLGSAYYTFPTKKKFARNIYYGQHFESASFSAKSQPWIGFKAAAINYALSSVYEIYVVHYISTTVCSPIPDPTKQRRTIIVLWNEMIKQIMSSFAAPSSYSNIKCIQ